LLAAKQGVREPVSVRRFLSDVDAATQLGLPLATFRSLVEAKLLPRPLPEVGLYDMKALDLACDRLSGLGSPKNALDAWKDKKNGSRSA
jgi:hypothetical protein